MFKAYIKKEKHKILQFYTIHIIHYLSIYKNMFQNLDLQSQIIVKHWVMFLILLINFEGTTREILERVIYIPCILVHKILFMFDNKIVYKCVILNYLFFGSWFAFFTNSDSSRELNAVICPVEWQMLCVNMNLLRKS
jgi:hypothetical protein